MSARRPQDAAARQRINEDLDTTLFVEAAAGTGKTTALVGRMVALILAGRARLDSIVALTFTDKAAGEMKLRLRAELERRLAGDATDGIHRDRLNLALSQLELARINTIHAFCGDLLRERPVEAKVDPLFEVAAADQQSLVEQAFNAWFEAAVADPPPGVRRVLRRPSSSRPGRTQAHGPREQLLAAARNLIEHRDFATAWERRCYDRDGAIDQLLEAIAGVGALASLSTWPTHYLSENLSEIDRWHAEHVRQRERMADRARDYDGLEAALRHFARDRNVHWHWKGGSRVSFGDLSRDEAMQRRDALKESLDAFNAACEADLAPLLRDELQGVVERYELLKAAAGKLDFLDLLIRARDLLVRDGGVRELMQRRFTHFFVDEFQDTDPLQAEILLLLASADPAEADWSAVQPVPGKLFIVGDPKQSIYRFRRADIAIYERIKRQLTACGAQVLHLQTSFRSRPGIQRFVNAAFSRVMLGDQQATYEALKPWREADDAQPAVVALPVPRPYADWGRVVNYRIEESLPEAVAAWIAWLVEESGWRVEEDGESVPVRPRHVCLLFRRFKSWDDDVTRRYVRALENRRLPHMLVGGRSFHDREEVQALRNALVALEWPDDELRVYATLRGPLFALTDEALLAWRFPPGSEGAAPARPLNPLLRPDPTTLNESEAEVAQALALLGGLHRGRNRRPIAETVMRLLRAVRAHAGIAIWPTGEQALANVLRVVDLARRFEARGALSFRAFVEQLEDDAQTGEAEDAPVLEEGTEGVRIMTAHKAKGLEFPVLVLADPTCRRVSERPSRHVDMDRRLWVEPLCGCVPPQLADRAEEEIARDADESVRLAYVAATRARDLLVVPAVGDEPQSGWLDVLHPALYPPDDARHLALVAAGCPKFGTDSVLERPPDARPGVPNVRPGLHRTADAEASVVWWDPSEGGGLVLEVDERVGLRQQRILAADEADGRDDAGAQGHARWQASREEALARGAAPAFLAVTATALGEVTAGREVASGGSVSPAPVAGAGFPAPPAAGTGAAADPVVATPVEVQSVARIDDVRPGGKRFGILVHAVLATVDLDADADAIEATSRLNGRLLGASAAEVSAAAVAVRAALAHPLMRRAAACGGGSACRREFPITHALGSGRVVEGVVDLAFRELRDGHGVWTVVDFKTDRDGDAAALATRYGEQLRAYAAAITTATGEVSSPVLLRV
jgi:ATP-dependent helicase/nuclease subunit A